MRCSKKISATGIGKNHQLLKHLTRDSVMVLFDIFNDIWVSCEFLNAGKRPQLYLFQNQAKTKNPVQLPSHISHELFMQNHENDD